jgi:FHA domain
MVKKTLSPTARKVASSSASALIRKPLTRGQAAAGEKRAYAKLQSANGACYYMTSFSATFGRGPNVDFVVSKDVAISRVHARIEYSNEAQAFELVVLGKNGAYVNGVYARKLDAPLSLQSQTEIIFGKANPVTMTFLLPCVSGSRQIVHKPQQRRPRSLLFKIGAVIVGSPQQRLSADEILVELRRQYGPFIASIGPLQILESSIRHALTANQHLFQTHSATDLEANVHAADVEMFELPDANASTPAAFKVAPAKVHAAKFSVVERHSARFLGSDHGQALGPSTFS